MTGHRSVEWDPQARAVVAGFTWRRIGEGVYEAAGECPECHGTMVRRWELNQYAYVAKGGGLEALRRRRRGGGGGREGDSEEDRAPLYTRCLCGRAHAGRPPEEDSAGCGAHLLIELPPGGLPGLGGAEAHQ
ncbi:hypothetical protein [Streptomyces xinghaiensis]|uniref:hypothetical protein n=1 Tax=Streptomyces xinghaiensis TaxID=1038928 RepID=UPI000593EF1B|nr:hypothetical protein [Streptomyces xinghaiensis]MZE79902.1 hypothetical protein [Streptomyces sp. SID5475]